MLLDLLNQRHRQVFELVGHHIDLLEKRRQVLVIRVDDHLAAVASARASAGEWSVNRAWRELLIPDSWRIAICGQAEELAPALAERGLEAVIVSPAEVLS